MKQLARLFRALGDPSRLRILNILSHSSLCVCDLQKIFGFSQPFISRHLAYLRKVNLVRTRREGSRICYSLARSPLFNYPLQSFLREVLPFTPEFQADLVRLAECDEAGRLKSSNLVQAAPPATESNDQKGRSRDDPSDAPTLAVHEKLGRSQGGEP